MATRTISTKLAIEGEGEYRAAISRINGELKALQSGVKLTESQFAGQANSMAALEAKGQALSKLYDAQKRKVEELRAALSNAQAAERAYAAQKAELQAKIDANNAALERLRASAEDTSEEEKRLTEENARLQQQLGEVSAKGDAAAAGVNRWQTQLNNAEAEANRLNGELRNNEKYMDEARRSTDGCAKSIDQFGKASKQGAEDSGELNKELDALTVALGAAGLKQGFEAVRDAIVACIEASSEFEYAMSGVGAVAGATSEEMAALTAKAKEIGATTMFTAGQTAEAMQYMALAGWSAEEMLDGIGGVMDLAAASGEDLAQVCDIVTDALTAFGLSANDTGRFVDVLAATAANSNTTVKLLGEAFKYAAPVAGALGYSIEDVAASIGLMANNGIKGSMAGTALRNLFGKLAGDVKLSADAFGEMVIKTSNADGSMRALDVVLGDLRGAFEQMTDAEKVSNAQALVGERAYAGLIAILKSTYEDYTALTGAIRQSTGAAREMAEVRMDNLQGQVTLMQSAFDALKIEIGDQLNPALRGLAEAGTDVLTWATGFVAEHREIVALIGAVATALGVLTAAVVGFNAVNRVAIPLINAFNNALTMSGNPIGLVAVALGTLIAAVTAAQLILKNDAVPTVAELASEAEGLTDSIDELNGALEDNLYSIEATDRIAQQYIDTLAGLEQAGELSAEQQAEWNAALRELVGVMPELSGLVDLETGVIEGGTAALREHAQAIRDDAKARAYQDLYAEYQQKKLALEMEREINRLRVEDAEKAAGEARAAWEEQTSGPKWIWNEEDPWGAFWDNFTGKTEKNRDALLDDVNAANDALKATEDAVAADDAALGALETELDLVARAYENLTGTAIDAGDEILDAAAVQQLSIDAINSELEELVAAYQEAHDAALKSIQGQVGLFDEFEAKVDGSTDSAEKMMERWAAQTQNLAAYTENLAKAASYGIDEGLVRSLSDGSAESAGYLQTIIGKIEELGGSTSEAAEFIAEFNAAFQATEDAKEGFAQTVGLMESGFTEAVAAMQEAADAADFSGFTEALSSAFADVGVDLETVGLTAGGALATGLDGSKRTVQTATDGLVGILEQGGADAVTNFDAEFQKISETTDTRLTELRETISTGFGTMPGEMTDIGTALVDGLIAGIDSRAGSLYAKIQSVVNAAVEAARAAADSHSPSRKTMKLGEDMGEGAALGWERKRERVAEAGRGVIEEALRQQAEVALKVQLARETIDPRMPELPKTAGGEPGSPREKSGGIVEHRHSGTVRIEGVDGEGRFVGAAEVVYEDLVARLQMESRW